ncbi:Tetratricopeptide repeat protein [Gimesia panareensis]|uniref:Tetratricopeptide repeat protein n=1 Tax=Gimesia panareensis TaxID=2527978 RepID=A0A517QFC3_9PLAN|nr:tetratricopeptide repeat protein [Gimesia panareensis]QDT30340.1 Tetratricopeptide repeat protein [Gimesia panareensis]
MSDNPQLENRLIELTHTIESDPDNTDRLYELGRALESTGKLEEALLRYEAIVRMEPGDHESIHAVGAINLRLGNNSAAILSLRKAVKLCEDQPDYLVDLGDALFESGDLKGAKVAYERALSLALPNEEVSERIKLALERFQSSGE